MKESIKNVGVIATGAIALLYLINPTAGVIELIPDLTPIVGNLDEAGAAALLYSSLHYFGISPGTIFKKKKPNTLEAEEEMLDAEA